MVRLRSKMHFLLQENVIRNLNNKNIFSVNGVLQEDPEKLVHIMKMPYKDVLELRQNLISNYSAFPCIGTDVYTDIVANSALIPSGIERLDEILNGGFLSGNIYEVCGLSDSGKTQLCISVLTNVAQFLKHPVLFIDTKHDFSGKRVQAMLEARGCSEGNIGLIMDRIQVARVKDVYQLLSFLHTLRTFLHQEHDEKSGVRLIVIDSLPSVLFPFLGGTFNSSLSLMNLVSNTIKYLSLEYNIPFLLVNLVTKWYEDENVGPSNDDFEDVPNEKRKSVLDNSKPALGKYWSHVPNTRLCLQSTSTKNVKQVNIVKTVNASTEGSCELTVTSEGFV